VHVQDDLGWASILDDRDELKVAVEVYVVRRIALELSGNLQHVSESVEWR